MLLAIWNQAVILKSEEQTESENGRLQDARAVPVRGEALSLWGN